jgi:hypothetical protein
MTASDHFVMRVQERMGPQVNAHALARYLTACILSEDRDAVQFVSRISDDGRRLFRFQTRDKRTFYAMVNTDTMTCITVLPPDFEVARQGKPRLKLD